MAPLKRHDRRMLSVDYRWSQFKSGALRREIPVSIDQHHYAQLIVSPCHYCWGEPTQASRIGIDRMDSKKGYSLENCVPCCPVCNFMKNTMKYADFLSHVQLIAGHVYKPSGSTVYHAQQGPPPHQPRWRPAQPQTQTPSPWQQAPPLLLPQQAQMQPPEVHIHYHVNSPCPCVFKNNYPNPLQAP